MGRHLVDNPEGFRSFDIGTGYMRDAAQDRTQRRVDINTQGQIGAEPGAVQMSLSDLSHPARCFMANARYQIGNTGGNALRAAAARQAATGEQ